jgi:flavin reductase (DIM6/NTAB) family NADH-FMN oxidoreductase RutF
MNAEHTIIHSEELKSFTRFYRGNLVNCLTGAKPAFLAGTKNESGSSNLALFTNVFHLGADPALIGYVQRPVGQIGDTFRNIETSRCFTLSLVTEEIAAAAHQTSARYPSEQSEFLATNLQEEYVEDFFAPAVLESPLQIGLRLFQVVPMEINDTKLVIAKVEWLKIKTSMLQEDGNLNFEGQHAVNVLGLENYYALNFLGHKAYAKV